MIKEVKLDVVGKFHLVHEIAWFLRMNLGMPGIPCPEHMLNFERCRRQVSAQTQSIPLKIIAM